MNVLVFGAGGIGGYYGGLLARAGVNVSFVARGAHLKALRSEGLTLIRDAETFTLSSVRADDDPTRLPSPDLILFTTKAYDLEAAAAKLAPIIAPNTLILPLLNGVDIPDRLARVIDRKRILAGLTYIPANRPRPGVVNQPGAEHPMIFGELNGHRSGRAEAIRSLFEEAGIAVVLAEDIQKAIWTKYMLVTANGGVCAVTRSPMGPVIRDAETRSLYEACCREVVALANAQGVALDVDAVERTVAHAEQSPLGNKPSMLQDLESGRPLELDVLHGTMVRLGRELGVPVPVAEMIHAVLKGFILGR